MCVKVIAMLTQIAVLTFNVFRDQALRRCQDASELVDQVWTIVLLDLLSIHSFSRVTTGLQEGIFLWVFVKEVRHLIALTVVTSPYFYFR